MRFHCLRPVTAYSRVIFEQISGDFEDGVAVSSYKYLFVPESPGSPFSEPFIMESLEAAIFF